MVRRPAEMLALVAVAAAIVACTAAPPASPAPSPGASSASSPSAGPSASPGAVSSSTASPGAKASTGRIVDTPDGFAITLADGWQGIGLTDASATADLAVIASVSHISATDAATYLETLRAILPGGVRLLAFRPASFDPKAKYMTTVNVLRLPSGSLTLDQLDQANLATLVALNVVKPIDHVRISLPAGQAVRFTYGFRVPNSGIADGIIQTTQYLLLGGGHQFVVTLSTGGPPTAEERADIAAMMDSFAILP